MRYALAAVEVAEPLVDHAKEDARLSVAIHIVRLLTFACPPCASEEFFVGNEGSQFQVRNGDATAGICKSDECILDSRRELEAPKNGCAEGACGVKPNAAHASLAGVGCAHKVGVIDRNQFLEPRGPIAERVYNRLKLLSESWRIENKPRAPVSAADMERNSPSSWCHTLTSTRLRGDRMRSSSS